MSGFSFRQGLRLLPPNGELAPSGACQRIYDEDHLKRLTFIRRSRELGLSLDEIRALLGLARGNALTCAEVREMARAHIAGIHQRMRDLKKLERVLTELAARCHGKKVPDCPILDALNG
jgi:MerR family mercuric resistance operon transcriptional regulator